LWEERKSIKQIARELHHDKRTVRRVVIDEQPKQRLTA